MVGTKPRVGKPRVGSGGAVGGPGGGFGGPGGGFLGSSKSSGKAITETTKKKPPPGPPEPPPGPPKPLPEPTRGLPTRGLVRTNLGEHKQTSAGLGKVLGEVWILSGVSWTTFGLIL